MPLLEKAGVAGNLDEGVISIASTDDVRAFMGQLCTLRIWAREPSVRLSKAIPLNNVGGVWRWCGPRCRRDRKTWQTGPAHLGREYEHAVLA